MGLCIPSLLANQTNKALTFIRTIHYLGLPWRPIAYRQSTESICPSHDLLQVVSSFNCNPSNNQVSNATGHLLSHGNSVGRFSSAFEEQEWLLMQSWLEILRSLWDSLSTNVLTKIRCPAQNPELLHCQTSVLLPSGECIAQQPQNCGAQGNW